MHQSQKLNRWIAIFFAISAFFFMVGCAPNAKDDPASKQLALSAIRSLALGDEWDYVKIEKATRNDYVLKLVYRAPPSNPFSISVDTRKIALAILSALTAAGRHPSSDETSVWVWAERDAGTGETGAKLVQVYGHTEYQYDRDQLEFKPWQR